MQISPGLTKNDELRPIVVDENNIVQGGNMRLKALHELGYKEIPETWVKQAKDFTLDELREFIIKDNVGFGEWDWDDLANNWDQEQLEDWGLDIPDFAFQKEAVEDDYEIPDEIETDIVLGDLFEIGQHRLLCGDSTKADDVAKLMNKKTAEMLFTSPPYSDMRTYNGNKDLSVSNLIEFIPTWMPYVNYQVINLGIQRKDNEIVQYWDDYIQKAKDCGYKFLSWNVWDRGMTGSIAQQTAMFSIHHEWIFVFGKERKKLNRTIENNLTEYHKRHPELKNGGKAIKKNRQKDGTLEICESVGYTHRQLETVNRINMELSRGAHTKGHPATFPVALPFAYIESMTFEKQIIAESFLGSGTTMVAAHQLNRKCYGIEIDPKYCQVIVDRMLKLDQALEIKKNGKAYKTVDKQLING